MSIIKLLSGIVSLVFISLFSFMPTVSAQATPLSWPTGGIFIVGDAKWQFDQYGLQYAWDVNDNWNSDGYLSYPNEFSFSHDPSTGSGGDYFLCSDPSTLATDVEITQLSSGAIDILCPELAVPGYPNLTAQLHFTLFPGTASGYLLRQTIAITNSSNSYEVIPDLELHNFPNLHTDYWQGQYQGHEEAEWFVDSINSPFVGWLWEDATYFSQGMGDGRAVAVTNAWARTGQAQAEHYFTDNTNGQGNPYTGSGAKLRTKAPNYFAPESTTHLLTYTNMVLPSAVSTAAGAVAKATVISQNADYANFSGRLIEGLPDCTTYAGWGTTPGQCSLAGSSGGGSSSGNSSPQPCVAALAETGFNLFIFLIGGLSAAAVGTWLAMQSRKTPRVKNGRIRHLLFPQGQSD